MFFPAGNLKQYINIRLKEHTNVLKEYFLPKQGELLAWENGVTRVTSSPPSFSFEEKKKGKNLFQSSRSACFDLFCLFPSYLPFDPFDYYLKGFLFVLSRYTKLFLFLNNILHPGLPVWIIYYYLPNCFAFVGPSNACDDGNNAEGLVTLLLMTSFE